MKRLHFQRSEELLKGLPDVDSDSIANLLFIVICFRNWAIHLCNRLFLDNFLHFFLNIDCFSGNRNLTNCLLAWFSWFLDAVEFLKEMFLLWIVDEKVALDDMIGIQDALGETSADSDQHVA